MQYGQIAGNQHINVTIYHCFEFISEGDARRFVRKFQEQLHDEQQVMHTFRELILGGYLGANGHRVRNELPLDGRTPDWSIVCGDDVPQAVVELVNFHLPRGLETEIEGSRENRSPWVGRLPNNEERLCGRIHDKAVAYREVVAAHDIPYVVAVYGEFTATVDITEIRNCVEDAGVSLFRSHPHVSGILFFEERSGQYIFQYLVNSHATRSFGIRDGIFGLSGTAA